MHTIVATDHKREQQFVLDSTEYVHTLRVNGDRIVTFTISESENNAEVLQLIDKRWSILIYENNKFEEYVVQNIYEETREGLLIVEVDTLYRHYDNLKREVLNETYTGSKTMEEWFKYAFKASRYKVVIDAEFQKARHIENFGYDHTLGLLFRLCNTYNVEFYITGDTVYIVDEIGEYKEDYVEYGINLQELSRDRVMEGFGTTVKMFGMDKTDKDGEVIGRWEVEYENKDLVREYGKIPLPTIYDERFNDIDAMMAECEQRVKDSMNISLNVVVDDLEFKDDDVSVYEGDYIRIYDDRIGFDSVIRIVEMRITRNHLGDVLKREYLIGDYDEEYANYLKEQQELENIKQSIVDRVNDAAGSLKDILQDIEDLNNEQIKELEDKFGVEIKDIIKDLEDFENLTTEDIERLEKELGMSIEDFQKEIENINGSIKEVEEWTKEQIDKTLDELQSVKLQAGSSAKIYRQATEPKGTKDVPLADGDLWYKTRWLGGQSQVGVEMYQYQMEGNTGRWHRVEDIEMGNADRLEKGTINAKVINLINLNANEIVTGTIRGQNLNINLDKGTVEFTKGKIYKTDGTFEINIDKGSIYSMSDDTESTGFLLERGKLSLRKKGIIGILTDEIGMIGRSDKVFNNLKASMLIESKNSMVIQTGGFSDVSLVNKVRKGSAIYVKNNYNPGNVWESIPPSEKPEHSVLYNKTGVDIITASGVSISAGSPKTSNLLPSTYASSYLDIGINHSELKVLEDGIKSSGLISVTAPSVQYGNPSYRLGGGITIKTQETHGRYLPRDPQDIVEGDIPTNEEKYGGLAKDQPKFRPGISISSANYLNLDSYSGFSIYNTGGQFKIYHNSDSNQGGVDINIRTKQNGNIIMNQRLALSTPQFHVAGDLWVTGKKNAIHVTRDGFRETPAYETGTAYIGDIGEITTDENGKCVVKISDPMYDISNTDINYQVFLSAYNNCNYWVSDRKPREFTINTDKPNCNIAYEIKAKRRGYENDHFEQIHMEKDEFIRTLEEMR